MARSKLHHCGIHMYVMNMTPKVSPPDDILTIGYTYTTLRHAIYIFALLGVGHRCVEASDTVLAFTELFFGVC